MPLDSASPFGEHIIVRHSKRARRLALRLDAQKRVFSLVIPRRMSPEKTRRFVEKNREWMRTSLDRLPAPVAFTDGAVLPLLGEKVLLKIVYDPSFKRTSISFSSVPAPSPLIPLPLRGGEGVILEVRTNQQDPSSRIIRFLKKLAREELEKRAQEKAARTGKSIKSVQVRDTRSRWGSCSHEGALSFSWRLIFAPRETLDYIVAHEVAHLVHLNHGKKFWTLCRDLSENFTQGRRWIRDNGQELMRYG